MLHEEGGKLDDAGSHDHSQSMRLERDEARIE